MDKTINILQINLYTKAISPRVKYTFETISQLTGGEWRWVYHTDIPSYRNAVGLRFNYSSSPIVEGEIFVPSGALLFERQVQATEVDVKGHFLFPNTHPQATLPFDLPAMVFYLLSRYEEYLPFDADEHGRFPANPSMLYQHKLLDYPIVDHAILLLQKEVAQRTHYTIPAPSIINQPTMDIDMAWCYKYKGWRTPAQLTKELLTAQFTPLKNRLSVLMGHQRDPYHIQYPDGTIYFFHLGDYGAYDKATPWTTPALQTLFKALNTHNTTGIHPSYRASTTPSVLATEKQRYQQIIGQAPTHSRQHFLKLHLPNTYQELIKIGIEHDFSMGYSSENGFRAGTAKPFYWYDLSNETATTLLIHPFVVMDVTLRRNQVTPAAAIQYIQQLQANMQSTGGYFSWIWHNSSFAAAFGWEGWEEVYDFLMKDEVER